MSKRLEAVKKAVRELRYDEMVALASMVEGWLPTLGDEDENIRDFADALSDWASQPERGDIRLVKSDMRD